MPGTTVPDPSVVIDMWVTHDAKSPIDAGHRVINSSDGLTYLVPGAHYYGVSNAGIYNHWEPFKISGDPAKNPEKADPHLLGGKLHIWGDQGPSGYTLTEVADLAIPSIQVFSEKLWGNKGSTDYGEFAKLPILSVAVPGVTILQRDPPLSPDGLVFEMDREITLSGAAATVGLPWAKNPLADMEYPSPMATPSRADLDYPWTLSMQINPSRDQTTRGVILSSDLVEICANYIKEISRKGPDGKPIKKTVTGFGLVRAAGAFGKNPFTASKRDQDDAVVGDPLPPDNWSDLTIVGLPRKTKCYVNGKLVGTSNNQLTCPLKRLGSPTGNSFIGKIRGLRVWNVARTDAEVDGNGVGR